MALAGGRAGWVRAALTAVGVGLGVAMLLVAASIPNIVHAQDARVAARDDMPRQRGSDTTGQPIAKADNTILVSRPEMIYRGQVIRGRLLQPEGPRAPVPPGLSALPRPGEIVVSPALARLLKSTEGDLLRPRLNYPIAGTITDAGLSGPSELAFYLGVDSLTVDEASAQVARLDHFGGRRSRFLDPVLTLIIVAIFVVLLLPVALFVASAIRFGGDSRDRRLAGVRLVGADRY
jgi:hypothetical protein